MQKLYCYIDESGTLPDPHDTVIIVAAVVTETPASITAISRQLREGVRVTPREKRREMKFYYAGDRTKRLYLKALAESSIEIFVLIVEKDNQSIPDTPENFAVLCYILLEACLVFYHDHIPTVIFDKHFSRDIDQGTFNNLLITLLGLDVPIHHADSEQEAEVNAADMVAGSLLWKYTGKDSQFYDLIKGKIVSEQVLHWKEAKRKFIEQLLHKSKNSP